MKIANADIELRPIPREAYRNFRREVIFACFKWDPQVGDVNTIADQVVILSRKTSQTLAAWAEELAKETLALEKELLHRPDLYGKLGLPRSIRKALPKTGDHLPERGVRVMRFDFHPTTTGWQVSEVNSDVPGGFSEASLLPAVAAQFFSGVTQVGHVGRQIAEALSKTIQGPGRIAFVFATSYADDRQVMQFLADCCAEQGHENLLIAPDHVRWTLTGAESLADGQTGRIDAIVRFFPVEWLPSLPKACQWRNYFTHVVPACNHASAILTQSKRLPLVWDALSTPVKAWKELLPPTLAPRVAPWRNDPTWILKPALGRVGEDITVPGTMTPKELKHIWRDARWFPSDWVAQRCFESRPLPMGTGYGHVCIGVFTVNGVAAGFYGRLSNKPRIDQYAQDIAVLVAEP